MGKCEVETMADTGRDGGRGIVLVLVLVLVLSLIHI